MSVELEVLIGVAILARLQALKAYHADELAAAEAAGAAKFKASLWHEWSCPGPHDYPREPDLRKGVWSQFHCVRCGHVLWKEKKIAATGAGMKASG